MLIPFRSRTCNARNAKSQEDAAALNITTLNDTMLQLVLEQDSGLRDSIAAAVNAKKSELEQKEKEQQQEEEENDADHPA